MSLIWEDSYQFFQNKVGKYSCPLGDYLVVLLHWGTTSLGASSIILERILKHQVNSGWSSILGWTILRKTTLNFSFWKKTTILKNFLHRCLFFQYFWCHFNYFFVCIEKVKACWVITWKSWMQTDFNFLIRKLSSFCFLIFYPSGNA